MPVRGAVPEVRCPGRLISVLGAPTLGSSSPVLRGQPTQPTNSSFGAFGREWARFSARPEHSLSVCRQDRERATLQGSDRTKVPLVERQDATRPEPSCEHYNREVRQPDIQVTVPSVDLPRRVVVARIQARTLISAGGKVLQEGAPRRWAEPPTKQVVDLGRDQRWDEQGASLGAQNLKDLRPTRFTLIGKGDQRGRVDDERH